MVSIGGLVLVVLCVIGGYLMEHGSLAVLIQPAEVVIILGAAIGSLVAGNSVRVVKDIAASLIGILRGEHYGRKQYLDTLKLLHDLFASARRNGAQRLEADIEKPEESPVFSAYPEFLKDHRAKRYLCDTLRLVLMGGVAPAELEALMEVDAQTHHAEAEEPVHALRLMAEALPGLGIVAAVLGIVVTMGALGGPASEIGHKVAAALVGTFLGVLLCYGFIGPLSHRVATLNEAHNHYFVCLRHAILAYVRGCGPLLCAEFARRSVPPHLRPSFQDFEAACKASGAGDGSPANAQEAAA
jgi:chemotaxis protein MotA